MVMVAEVRSEAAARIERPLLEEHWQRMARLGFAPPSHAEVARGESPARSAAAGKGKGSTDRPARASREERYIARGLEHLLTPPEELPPGPGIADMRAAVRNPNMPAAMRKHFGEAVKQWDRQHAAGPTLDDLRRSLPDGEACADPGMVSAFETWFATNHPAANRPEQDDQRRSLPDGDELM